jgi:hypothetical protein
MFQFMVVLLPNRRVGMTLSFDFASLRRQRAVGQWTSPWKKVKSFWTCNYRCTLEL